MALLVLLAAVAACGSGAARPTSVTRAWDVLGARLPMALHLDAPAVIEVRCNAARRSMSIVWLD